MASAIEDENRRLKRMYADLSMQADLLNCEGERHWSERT
jgi:putative transposase